MPKKTIGGEWRPKTKNGASFLFRELFVWMRITIACLVAGGCTCSISMPKLVDSEMTLTSNTAMRKRKIIKKRTKKFKRFQSDRFMRVSTNWRKQKGEQNVFLLVSKNIKLSFDSSGGWQLSKRLNLLFFKQQKPFDLSRYLSRY